VTLRRCRATIVTVAKQYYILSVCVCSLRYPACNTHASYCHLWPIRLYHILPHYFIYSTFKKKFIELFFIFCTRFVWNVSHSKKNWAR